jgi:uncharacterized protein
MIYKRNILPQVIQSVNEYPITLITGARQVGKTTLVSYFEENCGYKYLTFDDSDLLKEALASPKDFISKHGDHLILDEVQKAKELFPEIEFAVNEVRRKKGSQTANGMYILTGSQKFDLMSRVSESMSGRVGIIEMPPLSQAEIRGWEEAPFSVDNEKLFALSSGRELSLDELYVSIVRGFYPARWEIEGKPIKNYYANYVKTYIEKDVMRLINLTDKLKFENFLKAIAGLTGEEFIADNVSKVVGIDNKTTAKWLSIVLSGDLISLLPPYNETSINKRIVKRSKLYFCDTGLACYLLGIDTPLTLAMSPFKGRIVETYIQNEIRKSYLNESKDWGGAFFRDNNQNEIDLILLQDGKLHFIECKAGKNFGTNAIKGFSQLSKTSYDIKGECIICTSDEPYKISPNVYAFPIRCI